MSYDNKDKRRDTPTSQNNNSQARPSIERAIGDTTNVGDKF
jgi:hypothetical protein